MHLIHQLVALGIVLFVLAAPLGAVGVTRAGHEPPAPTAPQAGVVGDGSPASCDEAAVHAALGGGGSVTFNCGGPKQILIVHEQVISQATTIDGGGIITITGGLATRLFNVGANASLQLNHIALDSGAINVGNGGAIANAGTLRLNQVTIQNSQTDISHSGGAIFTSGPLVVFDSIFYKNTSGGGGAIFTVGSAVMEAHNTNFLNNRSLATSGGGGAIWVRPDTIVNIFAGVFSDNSSEANGGAVYNEGTFTADQLVFDANTTTLDPSASSRGFGGAIDNRGDLTLNNTFLRFNTGRYGGALNVGQGATAPVTRLRTTYIVENQALYSGGGIYASTTTTTSAVLTMTQSVLVENTANVGGGVSLNNSAVDILRSAIGLNHANSAGGLGSSAGPGPGGLVRIYDSTIYSNVITTTQGGAIVNQSLMDLRNLTLEGNTSGVFNSGSGEVMNMANTVLHNLGLNCDGTGAKPTSLGGNFSSDVSCSLGAVSGDVQGLGLNPLLSELQYNLADLSQFFAPLPGSPLINTATFPCSLHDQLGAVRPDACDKGAIEYHGQLPRSYLPLVRKAP